MVRGGTVVCKGIEQVADVAISGGKIIEVGQYNPSDFGRTIEANGLHIMPGVIDTQVHFREPGLTHKEDLESGTRAAICGGVTGIFEMPNTKPNTDSPQRLKEKLHAANGRTWCDYSFFMGGTSENADHLAEYEMLPGSPGIKVFMGSSTGSLLVKDDSNLERIFRHGIRPVALHAEDEDRLIALKESGLPNDHPREHPNLRDAEAARLATERAISLAEKTGRPIHILHISTADELPLILAAKQRGVKVTCEITPQHLYFAGPECYDKLGTFVQMNPPVRSEAHRSALRKALQEGLFDVIGSDHAPHTVQEKQQPYPASPSGMPGVQTLLPVMLNFVNQGLIDISTLVRMTAERPAQLYGIKDKGFVEPGMDADLICVDLKLKDTVRQEWLESKSGWSPYTGIELTGWPIHVLLRGHVQVEDRGLVGRPLGEPIEFNWKK